MNRGNDRIKNALSQVSLLYLEGEDFVTFNAFRELVVIHAFVEGIYLIYSFFVHILDTYINPPHFKW